jgi:DnaJ-class molecular chaperone
VSETPRLKEGESSRPLGKRCNANEKLRNAGRSGLPTVHFRLIFRDMVANAKKTDYECPICSGRGRVPGRLPGRTRLCPECHGTGRTTPIRREALLKRMKIRARG